MESLLKIPLEKYRSQIGVFLVLAILVGGGVLALTEGRSTPSEISVSEPIEATASSTPIPAVPKIKIDIAGAVTNPGVCELSENSRVEDALNAAGGLSNGADRDWISKNLNLAAKLSDGDRIYIPKVGETSVSGGPPASAGVVSGTETSSPLDCSRVNINTASAATLDECLPGIGPAYAQRIIEYREAHGGFKSIEEIQEVRGIGPKTFEKIKDQITVD